MAGLVFALHTDLSDKGTPKAMLEELRAAGPVHDYVAWRDPMSSGVTFVVHGEFATRLMLRHNQTESEHLPLIEAGQMLAASGVKMLRPKAPADDLSPVEAASERILAWKKKVLAG